MTARTRRYGFALVLVLAAGVVSLPARAASFLEQQFFMVGPRYDAVVPLCGDGNMLDHIQHHFAEKESVYWNSELTIVGFERVRETSFMPWRHGTIPRRFCSAVAQVSDGVKRPIYYSIGEDLGWIGGQPGVEFCVVGLDRNWAYNPRCKMARP